MTRLPPIALAASGLLALAELSLLLLLESAGDIPIAFPAVLCTGALACLLLLARSMSREDYGDAVAWGYSALPITAILLLFELSLAHVSQLFGGEQCDVVVGGCGSASPPYWIPLILTVGSFITTMAVLRRCKRVAQGDTDTQPNAGVE